jgi:hypothetical protein
MNFVTALGELVLAGVFATWYWTRDKVGACDLVDTFYANIHNNNQYLIASISTAMDKVLKTFEPVCIEAEAMAPRIGK